MAPGTLAALGAESAKETIQSINPTCEVVIHNTRLLQRERHGDHSSEYDIVVDGTDNFPTRYLTNDACVLLKKPNVYGSIFRFEGQASVFAPHLSGPCYRCLYPEPPPPGMVPSCAEGGVLGVLPGIVGCIQATEILKLALGKGTPLIGRLVLFNALDMKFRELCCAATRSALSAATTRPSRNSSITKCSAASPKRPRTLPPIRTKSLSRK